MSENEIDAADLPGDNIKRWLAQDTAKVTELAAELKAGKPRVFFYAASGFDWQPLHRFSHLCGCFVYVDPRKTEVEFTAAWQQVVDQHTKAGDGLRAVNQILHPGAAYDVAPN